MSVSGYKPTSGPRRILFVTGPVPWGFLDSGIKLRQRLVFDGLRSLGQVDVLLVNRQFANANAPDDLGCRVGWIPSTAVVHHSRAALVAWACRPTIVPEALGLKPANRGDHPFLADEYDLAWFDSMASYSQIAPALSPVIPTVLDLPDLPDTRDAHRRRLRSVNLRWFARLRAELFGRRLESAYRHFYRDVAVRSTLTVSSALDATRLPVGSQVVHNCYKPVLQQKRERPLHHEPFTMVFVGSMGYEPNAEGAHWFERMVLPRIAEKIPHARIMLVGGGEQTIAHLHAPPRVFVVGRVPDVGPHLQNAHVAVVPIRFGGGTRVKILEAMAHQLPCVATRVGAEGLDIHDGHDILLADDPVSFANAVLSLWSDTDKAGLLAQNALATYSKHYSWAAGIAAVHRAGLSCLARH